MKRALLLLLLLCSAMALDVTRHEVRITLHTDGSAYVEEEFLMRLDDAEKKEFSEMVGPQTKSYQWETFGAKKTIMKATVNEYVVPAATESDIAVVTLQYDVPRIVRPVEKRGRQQILGITEEAFLWFDGATFALPVSPATELRIKVPASLEAGDTITPPPFEIITENIEGVEYSVYIWNYRQAFNTGKFRVTYKAEASLQSTLSLETLWFELHDRLLSPIYIIALVILVAIIFWYRKELGLLITESFAGEPVGEDEI